MILAFTAGAIFGAASIICALVIWAAVAVDAGDETERQIALGGGAGEGAGSHHGEGD